MPIIHKSKISLLLISQDIFLEYSQEYLCVWSEADLFCLPCSVEKVNYWGVGQGIKLEDADKW